MEKNKILVFGSLLIALLVFSGLHLGCGRGVEEESSVTNTTTTTSTIGTTTTVSTTSTTGTVPSTSTTSTTLPKADSPVFVFSSGSYEANTLLITIEAGAGGADAIYYTLDGSNPTTSSPQYTGPISIETSKVVKAIAVKSGCQPSDISSAWYDLYWWQPLGEGTGSYVFSLLYSSSDNKLYVGGSFTQAGGISANRVARWDCNSSTWESLNSPIGNGAVRAMALDSSGTLYVGGDFNVGINHIGMRSNSGTWQTVEAGVNNTVRALVLKSGVLYAGGDFTQAGSENANYVATWEGSTWRGIVPSFDPINGGVICLALSNNLGEFYVGGNFTQAGNNNNVKYVAKWNGTAWVALGTGMNGTVEALVFDDSGKIYAGGKFTNAGGTSANRIAFWNDSSWTSMSDGFNDTVYALVYDSLSKTLYAGGNFTASGSKSIKYIAKWNGSSWEEVCGGLGGPVYALEWDGKNLYAGGYFSQAGGVSAQNIAKWGKKW